jgi:hypothetical protein
VTETKSNFFHANFRLFKEINFAKFREERDYFAKLFSQTKLTESIITRYVKVSIFCSNSRVEWSSVDVSNLTVLQVVF